VPSRLASAVVTDDEDHAVSAVLRMWNAATNATHSKHINVTACRRRRLVDWNSERDTHQ
jgi:hypothetical protein